MSTWTETAEPGLSSAHDHDLRTGMVREPVSGAGHYGTAIGRRDVAGVGDYDRGAPVPPARRDKRGRKIGYNWWREYNCDALFWAAQTWERECEAAAIGYGTETREYAAEFPRPTLKAFLIANKGMGYDPTM